MPRSTCLLFFMNFITPSEKYSLSNRWSLFSHSAEKQSCEIAIHSTMRFCSKAICYERKGRKNLCTISALSIREKLWHIFASAFPLNWIFLTFSLISFREIPALDRATLHNTIHSHVPLPGHHVVFVCVERRRVVDFIKLNSFSYNQEAVAIAHESRSSDK